MINRGKEDRRGISKNLNNIDDEAGEDEKQTKRNDD